MGVKFAYQLTQWCSSRRDIQFAIDQIEQYEPGSEGTYYVVKKNECKEVAIFTRGKERGWRYYRWCKEWYDDYHMAFCPNETCRCRTGKAIPSLWWVISGKEER